MSAARERPIAVTPGEPAGIGPDICVQLAQRGTPAPVVVIADQYLLAERAQALGIPLRLINAADAPVVSAPGTLAVEHVPLATPVTPGKPVVANSPYVLETLRRAADGCLSGRYAALATGPVQKSIINDAGIPFTGHTEFLAEYTATSRVVMMLVGGGMRVALATTHLPVRAVAEAIDQKVIEETLRILRGDLIRRFGIAQPRIAVAGLNPHAGEGGHLGTEERDIIIPVLERLRTQGFHLAGPLPADTLFNPERLREYDAVLTMYHDQGLPVLKFASFGSGINVTLGLPIVRTSVDHGTALDLAGSGKADPGSLHEAITLAALLAQHR